MNRFVKEGRPLEPNNTGEDPEGWADVADWEESRAEHYKARVQELEDFLEHEEHTYQYHENWWETRLERWKKNVAAGNDE